MTAPSHDWKVVACHGFSALPADRLLELALGPGLTDAPGDVVLVAERANRDATESLLATSGVGARPYFWSRDADGVLHHGTSVFAVARAAGWAWEWNPAGLQQLALLGHTLGANTLHPRVERLGADTVLRHMRGTIAERRGALWDEPASEAAGDRARDAFDRALADILADGRDPTISLSAGFDSRALLAGALHLGARPQLLTMGHAASTDRVVAASIASALGLPHETVELDASEYLDVGAEIVRATSATKLAGHWHTYLYSRRAADRTGVHLVGSNGEFARSFYADRGVLSRTLDAAGRRALRPSWALRASRWAARTTMPIPARERTLDELCDELVAAGGQRSPLDSLDVVYTTQRVRHFVGNGLALYALNGRPASPFLDTRWIRAARDLPRKQKLGSRWHRALILSHAPRLARFPIEGRSSMRRSPVPGYWLRRDRIIGYSPFGKVLAMDEAITRIVDAPGLDELFPRTERVAAVTAAAHHAMELMLTLSYACELAYEAGARQDRR